MAGHLFAILDMRPSTMIKGAALLTAPSTSTLSRGQTKQNNQTQPRQPTLTLCWDVNGCQDLLTLNSCMSSHPPQPKGPSELNRAFKQSTIMHAYDS